MLNNNMIRKDLYEVPEQEPIIILDRKSAVDMAENGKDTKHKIHIYRRTHFVINGEE